MLGQGHPRGKGLDVEEDVEVRLSVLCGSVDLHQPNVLPVVHLLLSAPRIAADDGQLMTKWKNRSLYQHHAQCSCGECMRSRREGTYDVVAFVNDTDLSLGNEDQGNEDAGQQRPAPISKPNTRACQIDRKTPSAWRA